ncbi:hypothetical protein, partial [Gluconobacter kondonii]
NHKTSSVSPLDSEFSGTALGVEDSFLNPVSGVWMVLLFGDRGGKDVDQNTNSWISNITCIGFFPPPGRAERGRAFAKLLGG